jgi:predicted transcriptional regulator
MFLTGTHISIRRSYLARCHGLLPELSEIAKKRRELGLTQRELAKKAGISRSWVAKVEKCPEKLMPSYAKTKQVFDLLERELNARNTKIKARKSVTVGEIHNENIVYAGVSETLREVRKRMEENYYSQLPVKDNQGRIVGSLTERDITKAMRALVETKQPDSSKVLVKAAMGDPFPTVSVATPVLGIVDLLQTNQAILTQEGQNVVGIVTNIDLAKILEEA